MTPVSLHEIGRRKLLGMEPVITAPLPAQVFHNQTHSADALVADQLVAVDGSNTTLYVIGGLLLAAGVGYYLYSKKR